MQPNVRNRTNMESVETTSDIRAAPKPKSILRGHRAQVHALEFIRGNERLVSGDADGYVTVWDLTILRPTAVWRAHEKAILNIKEWGYERLIT
jgi:ASTRA-associated protein 1